MLRPGPCELSIHMMLVASEHIEIGAEIRIDYEQGGVDYWKAIGQTAPKETEWRSARQRAPIVDHEADEPIVDRLVELREAAALGTQAPDCPVPAPPAEECEPVPWEGPAGGDERLDAVTTLLAGSIAIHRLGDRAWALAATHVPGRTGRECRDRWRRKNGLPDEEQEERPRPMPRPTFSSAESHNASKAAQRDAIRRANTEAARLAQATLARLAARLRDLDGRRGARKAPARPHEWRAPPGRRRGTVRPKGKGKEVRRVRKLHEARPLKLRTLHQLPRQATVRRSEHAQADVHGAQVPPPTKQMRAGPPNDILHDGDSPFQGANAVVEVEAVPVGEADAAQVDEAGAASVVELDPSQVVEVEAQVVGVEAQVVGVEAQVVGVEASPAVPDAAGCAPFSNRRPFLTQARACLLRWRWHRTPSPIQSNPSPSCLGPRRARRSGRRRLGSRARACRRKWALRSRPQSQRIRRRVSRVHVRTRNRKGWTFRRLASLGSPQLRKKYRWSLPPSYRQVHLQFRLAWCSNRHLARVMRRWNATKRMELHRTRNVVLFLFLLYSYEELCRIAGRPMSDRSYFCCLCSDRPK